MLLAKAMNTDFYLERGHDHPVCEDFAGAGLVAGQGYALVSDGCSSSKDVDFGSRILVHAARDSLTPMLTAGSSFEAVPFAQATIAKARQVLGCFAALPDSTLDATLLLALVRPVHCSSRREEALIHSEAAAPEGDLSLLTSAATEKRYSAQVCFWGDGVALVRRKDRVVATLLRFAGNAPFYLSYALNSPRQQAYLNRQGGRREILRVTFDLAGKEIEREARQEVTSDPLAPYEEQFELAAGESLALVSDGITQFFAADNTPVPWEALAPKLVDFKRPAGVFVRRRMNFFERENRDAGIRHLDDLSVAVITLLP
jgi:hypothetical protein